MFYCFIKPQTILFGDNIDTNSKGSTWRKLMVRKRNKTHNYVFIYLGLISKICSKSVFSG